MSNLGAAITTSLSIGKMLGTRFFEELNPKGMTSPRRSQGDYDVIPERFKILEEPHSKRLSCLENGNG